MRRFNRFGLIAVLAVAAAAIPAFAGNVTVGRFYTELAKAKHLGAVDASSAEASLRSAGFRLPQLSLSQDLTEGDVTAISSALGIAVTTSRPASVVTETQMNQFMSSFGSQLGAPSFGVKSPTAGNGTIGTDSLGGDPGNSGNGRGKKKGHNKSVSEPI